MLAEPTAAERALLGAMPYCTNRALLHTDESVLPRSIGRAPPGTTCVTPNDDRVLVSYDISRLMRLGGPRRYLVTLGGTSASTRRPCIAEMTYSHPVYTPDSVAAQELCRCSTTTA